LTVTLWADFTFHRRNEHELRGVYQNTMASQ